MIEVRRQALVMYSAQEMFDVVNNIAAYPEFIPNCRSTQVTTLSDNTLLGELVLSKAGFDVTFTTENTLFAPEKIELILQSGPLRSLTGQWCFNTLSQQACEIEFSLQFQTSGLLSRAVGVLIKQVADQMVQQFCLRAEQIYGKRL